MAMVPFQFGVGRTLRVVHLPNQGPLVKTANQFTLNHSTKKKSSLFNGQSSAQWDLNNIWSCSFCLFLTRFQGSLVNWERTTLFQQATITRSRFGILTTRGLHVCSVWTLTSHWSIRPAGITRPQVFFSPRQPIRPTVFGTSIPAMERPFSRPSQANRTYSAATGTVSIATYSRSAMWAVWSSWEISGTWRASQ